MVTPTGLVGLLVVLGLCWVVFHLVTQAGTPSALDRRERAELEDLRALVDDLKETTRSAPTNGTAASWGPDPDGADQDVAGQQDARPGSDRRPDIADPC